MNKTPIIVSIRDLIAHIKANDVEHRLKIDYVEDDHKLCGIIYTLHEAPAKMIEWLDRVGGIVEGNEQFTFDPERLDAVVGIANAVVTEYDWGSNCNVLRNALGLSDWFGDDCDYGGTHVEAIALLLRDYCDKQGIAHT